MKELTAKEGEAIKKLETLAKNWPSTLWLFAGSGALCIMKTGTSGARVYDDHTGAVNQDYRVANIDIPNDGGDF